MGGSIARARREPQACGMRLAARSCGKRRRIREFRSLQLIVSRSVESQAGSVGSILMAVQAASLEILEKADVPPAQARAIVQAMEIEIAGARDTLATKHDLLVLRNELSEKIGDLRTEMHGLASSNVRQRYAVMLGQTAVLLGVAYFFVAHLPR